MEDDCRRVELNVLSNSLGPLPPANQAQSGFTSRARLTPKQPHFREFKRRTVLIWNDRCQVDDILLFFILFFYIFFMTLKGAGSFDDESV